MARVARVADMSRLSDQGRVYFPRAPAPRPVCTGLAEPGAHRVVGDVRAETLQVFLTVDHPGVEPALEQRTTAFGPLVEGTRVAAVQPVHPTRQIRDRRLEHDVVVGGHQAVREE